MTTRWIAPIARYISCQMRLQHIERVLEELDFQLQAQKKPAKQSCSSAYKWALLGQPKAEAIWQPNEWQKGCALLGQPKAEAIWTGFPIPTKSVAKRAFYMRVVVPSAVVD